MTTKKAKLVIRKRKNEYVFKRDGYEEYAHTEVEAMLLLGAMIGATINRIESKNYNLVFNLSCHEYKN